MGRLLCTVRPDAPPTAQQDRVATALALWSFLTPFVATVGQMLAHPRMKHDLMALFSSERHLASFHFPTVYHEVEEADSAKRNEGRLWWHLQHDAAWQKKRSWELNTKTVDVALRRCHPSQQPSNEYVEHVMATLSKLLGGSFAATFSRPYMPDVLKACLSYKHVGAFRAWPLGETYFQQGMPQVDADARREQQTAFEKACGLDTYRHYGLPLPLFTWGPGGCRVPFGSCREGPRYGTGYYPTVWVPVDALRRRAGLVFDGADWVWWQKVTDNEVRIPRVNGHQASDVRITFGRDTPTYAWVGDGNETKTKTKTKTKTNTHWLGLDSGKETETNIVGLDYKEMYRLHAAEELLHEHLAGDVIGCIVQYMAIAAP